ncbi:uncharacterized protein AMSG_07405 [Thecamonas trahens ATCC 50062]|uniref:PH domain-containing protein n=1 Tax=Thecamonas trahens ATCC 50062 TaxID=461836 RepID=A0A0L0DGQ8_THETB|nr:hypothetical protein AMSG_07405 [Thecamonas trahens ATCC 50062]KNC51512.1 hypothetical protein AMSG_07405 [Thecamonas trahens ATCC 50062]|eukprot:XP_013755915.1 hypothetical protein AMSG_07405 [Thecamonas trahens ATCC 50062]
MASMSGFRALSMLDNEVSSPVIQRRRNSLASEQPNIVFPPYSKQGYAWVETKPTEWSRRYFVVKAATLYGFEHKVKSTLTVTASTQASVCNDEGPVFRDPETSARVPHPYIFTVTIDGKTLVCACQNPKTRSAWIKVLCETSAAQPSKGCVGYLLVKSGKSKWNRQFISLSGDCLTLAAPKVKNALKLNSFGDDGFTASARIAAQLGVSASRSTVAATLTDAKGNVSFGHRLVVVDGKKRLALAFKSETTANSWAATLNAAISKRAYIRELARTRTLAESATRQLEPLVVSERELHFLSRQLESGSYGAVRGALWAYAMLSAHGSNRIKFAAPDMYFLRSLCTALASPMVAEDDFLRADAVRILNNLAATPRVHADILQWGAVDALIACLDANAVSSDLSSTVLALRAIKMLALHRSLADADIARLADCTVAGKRKATSGSAIRAHWKEVSKILAAQRVADIPSPSHSAPIAAAENVENAENTENAEGTLSAAPAPAPVAVPIAKLISFSPIRAPLAAQSTNSAASSPGGSNPLDDSFERFMCSRATAASTAAVSAAATPTKPSAATNPFSSAQPTIGIVPLL